MHYRNRMYATTLGRFGRRDLKLGGNTLYNAYGFPWGNGVRFRDPRGLCPDAGGAGCAKPPFYPPYPGIGGGLTSEGITFLGITVIEPIIQNQANVGRRNDELNRRAIDRAYCGPCQKDCIDGILNWHLWAMRMAKQGVKDHVMARQFSALEQRSAEALAEWGETAIISLATIPAMGMATSIANAAAVEARAAAGGARAATALLVSEGYVAEGLSLGVPTANISAAMGGVAQTGSLISTTVWSAGIAYLVVESPSLAENLQEEMATALVDTALDIPEPLAAIEAASVEAAGLIRGMAEQKSRLAGEEAAVLRHAAVWYEKRLQSIQKWAIQLEKGCKAAFPQ